MPQPCIVSILGAVPLKHAASRLCAFLTPFLPERLSGRSFAIGTAVERLRFPVYCPPQLSSRVLQELDPPLQTQPQRISSTRKLTSQIILFENFIGIVRATNNTVLWDDGFQIFSILPSNSNCLALVSLVPALRFEINKRVSVKKIFLSKKNLVKLT